MHACLINLAMEELAYMILLLGKSSTMSSLKDFFGDVLKLTKKLHPQIFFKAIIHNTTPPAKNKLSHFVKHS